MSKYTTISLQMNDEECIKAALKECGYKNIEVYTEPQTLYGIGGKARPEKAHIIVRRAEVGPAANDLGFLKTKNGKYEMFISEFDKHKLTHGALKNLEQQYGVHRFKKQIKGMGMGIVSQKTDNKGRVKIKVLAP